MSIKIKDGREELWQWDTERFLTVSDDVDFVHFSNLQYGNAFTSEVVNCEARIPDELLQVNGQLYSYVFKGSVENGYTEYSERFEIKKKPKPVDYVFTPTEYITIESLDKRVEKLEKQGGGGGSVFSPTVEIQSIDGGHKVIITDINGNHEFDVLDGKKGDKGEPGNDYVLTESDKQEIADMIEIPDIPESGTTDYTKLKNKPKINGVELDGDKTLEALGIPTGGGSVDLSWKLISTVNIESGATEFIITEDDNGKPFSYREILLKSPKFPTHSGYLYMRIGNPVESGNVQIWTTAGKTFSAHYGLIDGHLGLINAYRADGYVGTMGEIGGGKKFYDTISYILFGESAGFTDSGTIYLFGR